MEEFDISSSCIYKRRKPENTILYQTVLNHLDEYIIEAGDVPTYVITAFRKYLECGILAHGFGRARCKECGLDFLIAFSCKQRGACPSCNTKYMVETSAHIVDKVLPRVNYRQWVLALPKRIRYFIYKESHHAGKILRIFHTAIERLIRKKCINKAEDGRIGAVSFIQRFGAFINVHVHYHSIVTDGVFIEDESGEINFKKADEITDDDVHELTNKVRKSVMKYMIKNNLIDPVDAEDMLRWKHNGGFSIDCKVRIDKDDRLGLENLLRYCSRPPLKSATNKSERSSSTKKKVCSIWAIMIARIFEVMPLICTRCGKPMKIISFITEKDTIGHILNHIGESVNPPHPTRSPPVEIFEQHPLYLN